MSEETILSLNQYNLDIGVNNEFEDYLDLFPKNSRKKIPYYYANEIVEYKDGYSAKLKVIKERLEIMGYTLKKSILAIKEAVNSYNVREAMDKQEKLNFHKLYDYLINVDIVKNKNLDLTSLSYMHEPLIQGFDNDSLNEFFINLDSRYILRVLAENPANLDKNVRWEYADVVEADYVYEKDILKNSYVPKILIATEGKTDSDILRQSIDQLFPEISDIFYFFNYSNEDKMNISGCEELAKFCKLVSQLKHGKVIALFDNDGDGNNSYFKAKDTTGQDKDLLITKLPPLRDMNNVLEKSPWNDSIQYINANGKAVAIENFLDFKSIPKSPEIIWEKGKYKQGRLKYKKEYQEAFKKAANHKELRSGKYNTGKLKYLIKYLIKQWVNFTDKNIE